MKKIFIAVCAVGVMAGCSSNKDAPQITAQNLVMDRNIQPLSRTEQIDAIKDCQEAGLRPRVIYGKRQVNGYSTETVIDVLCANRYAF
jgi:uncharacterized protein YcfL